MAELEKGTIAYELQELAKAKDDIAAALSSALTGTNENGDPYTSPFIEYGNLIRALTAVNVAKYKDGDTALNIHELYSPNRVAVYYVSADTYKTSSNIINHPIGEIHNFHNFWLMSLCDANDVKTQIAWIRSDGTNALYIWHSKATDTGWVKFYTAAEIDAKIGNIDISAEINNLKDITSVINPSDENAKPGDIKVDGKDIYIRDGENNWQLMNSWQ